MKGAVKKKSWWGEEAGRGVDCGERMGEEMGERERERG
jgi:hypothetical protein